MTGKVRHDRIARALGRTLYGAADIADAVARARLIDSRIKCVARYLHQPFRMIGNLADRSGSRRTAIKTLINDAEVESNDIAGLEAPSRLRNAVDDLLVNRHAEAVPVFDVSRLVTLERRARALLERQGFGELVQLQRRDPGRCNRHAFLEHFRHDTASLAHHGDLVGAFEQNHLYPFASPVRVVLFRPTASKIRRSMSSVRPSPSIYGCSPRRPY